MSGSGGKVMKVRLRLSKANFTINGLAKMVLFKPIAQRLEWSLHVQRTEYMRCFWRTLLQNASLMIMFCLLFQSPFVRNWLWRMWSILKTIHSTTPIHLNFPRVLSWVSKKKKGFRHTTHIITSWNGSVWRLAIIDDYAWHLRKFRPMET